MSTQRQRVTINRDLTCAVSNCNNEVQTRTCKEPSCTRKVCALHYGNSTLCAFCSSYSATPVSSAPVSTSSYDLQIEINEDSEEPVANSLKEAEGAKEAEGVFQKGKLFARWDDAAMLFLCKQVQLFKAHLKTIDAMPVKWGKVASALFTSYPNLDKAEWQALQRNYNSTSTSLVKVCGFNQFTNLSAFDGQPHEWHKLMFSLAEQAKELKAARDTEAAKVTREKRSMEAIESQVLQPATKKTSTESTPDSIATPTGSVEGDVHADSQSKKSNKTSSVRSESPPTFDYAAMSRSEEKIAQV